MNNLEKYKKGCLLMDNKYKDSLIISIIIIATCLILSTFNLSIVVSAILGIIASLLCAVYIMSNRKVATKIVQADKSKEIESDNIKVNEHIQDNLINEKEKIIENFKSIFNEQDNILKSLNSITNDQYKQIDKIKVNVDDIGKTFEQGNKDVEELAEAMCKTMYLSTVAQENMMGIGSSMEKISTSNNILDESIKGVVSSMNEVTEIINFIGNIAEQTNLLALNAAIEAARAGEAGKGFAVVADSIRKLADDVKGAVNNVDKIISDVTEAADKTTMSASENSTLINESVNIIKEAENNFKMLLNEVNNIDSHANVVSEIRCKSSDLKIKIDEILEEQVSQLEIISGKLKELQNINKFQE